MLEMALKAVNNWSAYVDARRDPVHDVCEHGQVLCVFVDLTVRIEVFAEVCVLFCTNALNELRTKRSALENV